MSDESSTGRSDPASQASGPDPDTAVDEPDLEDAASAGEEPADNNNDDVEESPRDEDEEDDDGNLVDGEGGAEEHDAQSSAGSPRPDSAAQANEPSSEPAIAAAGLAPQTVGEPSPSAATAAPVSSIGNMTEQEVYAMALNEFKTKGEPEAGPAPPRRRLQVPRLDELCIAKIAANLSEWPLLDQVPQQYVSSIVRRVAPATIQLSRAAQQISSEVFWKHMSARWPLAEVAHHGSSYKRLFFENFLQERLEQYHASKAASTLQDVMADVEAARPFVHTVRLGQQRAHINLAHVFKGFFNLTTLDLVYGAPDVGMNFDPDLFGMKSKDASALSTMLLETRSLSNFYVRQSQVDDELLGLLMRGLTGNQTVTCLDLSHNRISNDGAVKLAEMLTHDCVLISLNLADNCISGEGGAALGHALSKNATLQELSLRLNDVGDQGGAALLRGLIDNNTLESLYQSCYGLGAHSQAALVDLIHHGNALTSIDVSGNDCVPEDDAGARLLQEVRDNAMISYLDLRENKSLSAAVDAEISALLYAREERIERTRRQNYFAERMPAH